MGEVFSRWSITSFPLASGVLTPVNVDILGAHIQDFENGRGGGGGGGGPLSNLKLVAQGLCSLSYHVTTAFVALLSSSSFGSAFDTCLIS